jgi:phage repressor protein C with HTH and peptisase S24 domain
MSNISNLIKNKRISLGLTQSELAKMVGVTSVAISKWELNLVNPKPKHCQKLEEILGINAKVLMGTEKVRRSDYVDIPFYSDVCAAAGDGYVNQNEYCDEQIMVPLQAIKGSQKKDVICISAKGDSMNPVFGDGAILAIDRSKTDIKDGMIYVVSYGDSLRVKVLFRVLSGIRLCSFNPMFKDEEYNNSELEEFKIIGKVIWYSVIAD